LPHLLFCGPLVLNFPMELFCKQSPVYGVFLDRYFHIPLPIVTKHELGLPFPPRKLRITFGANPSTIFFVIVVTDRHTDRQTDKPTPVKTYSLAFTGIIYMAFHKCFTYLLTYDAWSHLSRRACSLPRRRVVRGSVGGRRRPDAAVARQTVTTRGRRPCRSNDPCRTTQSS